MKLIIMQMVGGGHFKMPILVKNESESEVSVFRVRDTGHYNIKDKIASLHPGKESNVDLMPKTKRIIIELEEEVE